MIIECGELVFQHEKVKIECNGLWTINFNNDPWTSVNEFLKECFTLSPKCNTFFIVYTKTFCFTIIPWSIIHFTATENKLWLISVI